MVDESLGCQSETESSPKLDQLLSRATDIGGFALRRWTLRIHETVAREIEALAATKGMSLNAYVTVLFDEQLRQSGRPGVSELAPEFVEYLRRRNGMKKSGGPSEKFDPFSD